MFHFKKFFKFFQPQLVLQASERSEQDLEVFPMENFIHFITEQINSHIILRYLKKTPQNTWIFFYLFTGLVRTIGLKDTSREPSV